MDQTYEAIMRRILERVPPNIDKREGSMIWDATGPGAVEMAILYTALDFILQATFADTAPREYLIRRAEERGMTPYPATFAVFRAEFNRTVPIGARFSIGTLNYTVTERMVGVDTPTAPVYRAQCETAGAVGNSQFGRMVPIEYIDGLTNAELVELLIPGAEEEDTEAFRQRYLSGLLSQAFGGNQTDYKEKVLALPGVGAIKVFPTWNSNIAPQSFAPSAAVTAWYNGIVSTLPPEVAAWLTAIYTAAANLLLTVGGTVKLVIASSVYGTPSNELLADVQNAIDPPDGHGEGLGLAPIGHVVSVQGVESTTVNVALTLTYQSGWSWEAVESYVFETIDSYFTTLAQDWQDEDTLIVRVSQIETRVLMSPGIVDVQNTLINGSPDNLMLGAVNIPMRGVVSG